MTKKTVDTAALSSLWDDRWPELQKIPFMIRQDQERWVRFHALPDSKRYAETATEYVIILDRHARILNELIQDAMVLVFTSEYSDTSEPPVEHLSPEAFATSDVAVHWASTCVDDELGFESWIHLYVSQIPWVPGCLDILLRRVADYESGSVLLADPGLRWLYHPYDGGMDVLLPTTAERDVLRDRHRDWLSAYPHGL